jgi:hypothetical protein
MPAPVEDSGLSLSPVPSRPVPSRPVPSRPIPSCPEEKEEMDKASDAKDVNMWI